MLTFILSYEGRSHHILKGNKFFSDVTIDFLVQREKTCYCLKALVVSGSLLSRENRKKTEKGAVVWFGLALLICKRNAGRLPVT